MITRSLAVWGGIGVIALVLNGCFFFTSRDDGEHLKQEVQHLQDRLVKLEEESDSNRSELENMVQKAQGQLETLEETLQKATRVLARNSADFGAEMDQMQVELDKSKGSVAELLHELENLKKDLRKAEQRTNEFALAAGLDVPIDESRVPREAVAHFKMIKDSFSKGRYGEVRSLAKVYQDRYPRSKNLDEVQMLIGKTYVAQKRYAKALGEFRRFADHYPRSEHMPEVFYEMANSFFLLGDCTDARILIDTVTSRYKSSPFAKKAGRLKDTINKSKSRCTS